MKRDADRDSTVGAGGACRCQGGEQPAPQAAVTTSANGSDEVVAALDRLAATVELATRPGLSGATVRSLLLDDIGGTIALLRHLLAADDGQNQRPPSTAPDGDRSVSG